jgi:urea carboxylase-associated protein 2
MATDVCIDADRILWTEQIPGGVHWSGIVRRGTTLRITDISGGANMSILMYNQEEKIERYNMADTLKAQHTAHLTKGHACYSDMGRILCSITEDTVGWHDPIGGLSDAALVEKKYGRVGFQEARNGMYRNGRDSLLIEIGKYGLGKRDLVAPINLFSKVVVDEEGRLNFVPENSKAGDFVDLRFEMNTLVALSTCPHPLNPSPDYQVKPVKLTAWRSEPVGEDDLVRNFCPENGRGFANTERLYAGL